MSTCPTISRGCRWTSLIPASFWTTIAAFSALGAFAFEIEGAHVWDVSARGINSMLVAELDRPWGESQSCTNCGKCVQVCPTGALVEKGYAVEEMIKRKGFVEQLAEKRGTST